jgi:hypothetical protein
VKISFDSIPLLLYGLLQFVLFINRAIRKILNLYGFFLSFSGYSIFLLFIIFLNFACSFLNIFSKAFLGFITVIFFDDLSKLSEFGKF